MRKQLRGLAVFLAVMLLGTSLIPASAQVAPSITVNAVWRPGVQLSTIDINGNGVTDTGDDIRYVTADIYASLNVEFWAVGFTCTVNKAVLESYVVDGDPNSLEDHVSILTGGADWTNLAGQIVDTTDTDGKFSFALSQMGQDTPPAGSNGITRTMHIARIRYRVKEGLTVAITTPFTCTANFLNRDGKVVVPATFVPGAALSVIPGYQLTGKVTYQGTTTVLTAAQAVGIQCDDADGDAIFDDVVTTANITTGLFSVNNLRSQGRYDCQFFGNVRTPGVGPDLHLMSSTDFNLTTSSMALLPVTLQNGNVDTSDTAVVNPDLLLVTSNWNAPLTVLTTPYLLGDATGDRKINESDLAIVAGNQTESEPVAAQHIIYSLPRESSVFQNSHLWLGAPQDASVTQFVAGNTRDYWPSVSPDGAKIVFVRNVGTTGDKYALFTAPIVNGVAGAAVRLTPVAATYDAFAPAWSLDGSQIAFICSYNSQWFSATGAAGNLCLIDANGLNFRLPTTPNPRRPIPAKLQPPAWSTARTIYFAYAPEAGVSNACDNRVCIFDVQNYNVSNSAFVVTGTDMPVVRNGALGPTLFYRFDNGAGSRTIRYVQLNTSSNFATSPSVGYPDTTVPNLHADVSSGSTAVGYFTVSTGFDPDIILYNNDPANDDPGGTKFNVRIFTGDPNVPNWAAASATAYSPGSSVGNPAFASGYFDALLNTVAFVP